MLENIGSRKLKQSTYFTIVAVLFGLNGLLGLARLLLYASVLGPSEFGLFSIAQLIITIGAYMSTLGFIEALNRQIPILIGEKKQARANYLVSMGLGLSLLLSTLLGVIFYVSVSLFPVFIKYTSIDLVGLLLVGTIFFNLVLAGVRGKSMTLEAGFLTLIKTVLAALMGFYLASSYGAMGVILAEAFALFLIGLYGAFKYLPGVFPIIRRNGVYYRVISIGLPFLLGNVILNLSQTVDSWFVQWVFEPHVYGLYAFAMIIFIAGQNFTGIIIQYVQPRIFTEYGRTKDHNKVLSQLHRVASLMLIFFIIGAIPFYYILIYVLESYYTSYLEIKVFAMYIYTGTGAMGILGIYESYVLVRNKGAILMKLYSLVLLFICLACWAAKVLELDLLEFAIIFCFGRIMCLLVVIFLNRHLKSN